MRGEREQASKIRYRRFGAFWWSYCWTRIGANLCIVRNRSLKKVLEADGMFSWSSEDRWSSLFRVLEQLIG